MQKKKLAVTDDGDGILSSDNLKVIRQYILNNTVLAQEGRKCVDGRYLPNQAPGMIARPGGDGGYVMALMAVNRKKKLGLTPEQCFNAIYKAVENESGFGMHTDHHTDPDSHTHIGLIGCGHLAKAANKKLSKAYDVDNRDVVKLIDYARNLTEISDGVQMVNLAGEHQEKAVLVIQSKTETVIADNPKLHQMYFIYDELRDSEFIKKLIKKLNIPEVTYSDMKEESDLQLKATLENLALGLPVYHVSYANREPVVTYQGTIESSHEHTYSGLHLRRFAHRFLPSFNRFSLTDKN